MRSFFLRSRTSPLVIWKELRRLRSEMRNFKPDVVHAHYGTTTAFISALASKTPLVVTFHGSDLNPAPAISQLRSKLGHALSYFAAKRAAQIICVSPQLCERISSERSRIQVVPCGVNMKLFRPMPQNECREKLGWNLRDKIVLFNARTDPVGKRLDLAEAASDFARQQMPNFRLHVLRGKTPPDEMPLYYSAADVLLMTSDFEGSPMVVKEGMACNLPIVSVDVGDVVERLAGVSQSVVVERNAERLGKADEDLLGQGCRSNGREFMRDLSEDNIAKRILAIYRLTANLDEPSLAVRQLKQTPNAHARAHRKAS